MYGVFRCAAVVFLLCRGAGLERHVFACMRGVRRLGRYGCAGDRVVGAGRVHQRIGGRPVLLWGVDRWYDCHGMILLSIG